MPVTVRGTDILFNDNSTQSTAASAPTTATVLAATAGASVGAVGTYALLSYQSGSQESAGATVAGSALRYSIANGWSASCGNYYAGAFAVVYSGTPSGTWRCMGFIPTNNYNNVATLWLRIS